jgi:MraZ protein
MFLGRDLNKLDDKYRLTVPARYREELVNGAYILQGFDRNLMIVTPPMFDAMARRVNDTSITDGDSRLLRRMVFSTAERVELDKSGRVLIPDFLRDHAGLLGEVMVVGAGAYFEIWSPAEWKQQDLRLQDAEVNGQRFAGLDLSTNL